MDDFEELTLRDYFAAKALQGLVREIKGLYDPTQMQKVVELSYTAADAMLKERKQNG